MMDKTAGKHDEQDDRMAGHNDLNPWNRNSSVDVLCAGTELPTLPT